MSNKYLIPNLKQNEFYQQELSVKKSVFIASAGHVSSVEQAREFIAFISAKYRDARHNCYAFNAGAANSSAYVGISDDGEPHGTAGAPMLNVLLHSNIGEICVVVTRYFGGILLGTGGLVKAYQDSTKLVIDNLSTCLKEDYELFTICVPHQYFNTLMYLKTKFNFQIENTSYADDIKVVIKCVQTQKQGLLKELQALSKGQIYELIV